METGYTKERQLCPFFMLIPFRLIQLQNDGGVKWDSFVIGGLNKMQSFSEIDHGSNFRTAADSP